MNGERLEALQGLLLEVAQHLGAGELFVRVEVRKDGSVWYEVQFGTPGAEWWEDPVVGVGWSIEAAYDALRTVLVS